MREQVWNGILDTDRLIRYYGALADKYARFHRWISFGIISLSGGAVATLLSAVAELMPVNVGAAISALFFLVVASLGAIALVWDFSAKAATARSFRVQYGYLAVEWEVLWYDGPIPEKIDDLKMRYERIVGNDDLPLDRKLHDRAESDAYESLPQLYGNSPNRPPTTVSAA